MNRTRPRITTIGAGVAVDEPPRRGGLRWAAALAWALALAGVGFGLNRLEPAARALSTADTRVEWVNLPTWLREPEWRWVVDELAAIPEFAADTDIFDANVTAYVGEQLSRSPWIERIDRVTKHRDGRVRVAAHFRKPFTMIEKDGWAYVVDETGVRLPGRLAASEVDHSRGLTIVGVRAAAPPEGQRWPGRDVEDGIKLVRFLWQAEVSDCLPIRKHLRSVDVSNADGSRSAWEGRLRILTTRSGNVIHWGRPPHEEYNIEADATKKLEALCEESRIRRWFEEDRPIDVRAGSWVDRIQSP